MPVTTYAAHVARAQAQGLTPLSVSRFIRLVVEIYRMEQYESK